MHEGGEEESLETPVILINFTVYISTGTEDERNEN